MEQILKKASELGQLIKKSEVSKKFYDLNNKLEADQPAKKIMDEFKESGNIISQKEKNAEPVEVWEKEKFQQVARQVAENDLLTSYIEVQAEYMEFMLKIQQAITASEKL